MLVKVSFNSLLSAAVAMPLTDIEMALLMHTHINLIECVSYCVKTYKKSPSTVCFST